MIVTITGDPESVSSLLQDIVDSGNDIVMVQQIRNNSTYLVRYEYTPPVVNEFILLENGDRLLLESGDSIILQ